MRIIDIVKSVALLVGLDGVTSILNGELCEETTTSQKEVELLVTCYNVVAEEIASEYFKLKAVDTLVPDASGVCSLTSLTYAPTEILKVYNTSGNQIKPVILQDKIVTLNNIMVEYSYIPPYKNLNDVSDYKNTCITKRVLSYGVATEFCLIKGSFEEASVWHQKYVDALKGVLRKTTLKKLKGRVWQ